MSEGISKWRQLGRWRDFITLHKNRQMEEYEKALEGE